MKERAAVPLADPCREIHLSRSETECRFNEGVNRAEVSVVGFLRERDHDPEYDAVPQWYPDELTVCDLVRTFPAGRHTSIPSSTPEMIASTLIVAMNCSLEELCTEPVTTTPVSSHYRCGQPKTPAVHERTAGV